MYMEFFILQLYIGRRLYEFNNLGHRLSKRWIPNGMNAMPEQARAAFAVNSTEIYILGVSQIYTKTIYY
jgi:hypothetical protein